STTNSEEKKHPYEEAGWISRTLYLWATPLLRLGNQRQIDPSDIWPLQHNNQCSNVSQVFEPKFKSTRSVINTIFTTYGWRFVLVGLLQVGTILCTLYGPVVLRQVLEAIEREDDGFDVVLVLKYIVSLFVVKVLQAIVTAHATFDNQVITVKITSALQHLLFQKALVLDAKVRREKSAGEISNMFSADIQTIIEFSIFLNQLWLTPVQLVVVLYMIYNIIGWATFAGAGAMITVLFINHLITQRQWKAFGGVMANRDARMKVVNEVFGSMQIIKLQAWEENFHKKLTEAREKELQSIWSFLSITSLVTLLLYTAPVLLTTVSFAVYTLVMKQSLTSSKMFSVLSLFSLARYPLIDLPFIFSSMMQALVSLKRIMEFLNMEEKDPNTVMTPDNMTTQQLNAYADKNIDVQITDGSFAWDTNLKPFFDHINLTVKRGEFVVIHGSVGEGKSSLCSTLLGEMHKLNGSVFVGGQVAYF
ncbi:ATP-binding Cassette (ABC) Superfamily, partial [Thraustotheca clavata]